MSFTARSDLGLISHLNGSAILPQTRLETASPQRHRERVSHLKNPLPYRISGSMALPSLSTAFDILSVASIDTIRCHAEDSTRCAPAQRLIIHETKKLLSPRMRDAPATEAKDKITRIPSPCRLLVNRRHEAFRIECLGVMVKLLVATHSPLEGVISQSLVAKTDKEVPYVCNDLSGRQADISSA